MDLLWLVVILAPIVVMFWDLLCTTKKREHREPGIAKEPIEYNLKRLSKKEEKIARRKKGTRGGGGSKCHRPVSHDPKSSFSLEGFESLKSNLDMLRGIHMEDYPTSLPLGPIPSNHPEETKTGVKFEKHLDTGRKDDDSGFQFVTITNLYNAFRSNKVTPLQVIQRALRAIEDMDNREPKLRAFVQVNKEEVLKMAKASTARYTQDDLQPLSFLDGIPVAFKEEFNVVPYHTRNGTTFMGKTPANRDAAIVKKLRDAGAVILGITNMHEVGIGTTGSNINRLHGTPRNPYNTEHYTGGSSSGSAAAVALGVCPVAFGTDGGGSIRVPAAACGAVGLKASFGRISSSGITHISHSVSHPGPICSNVRDAALVYAFVAGPDQDDLPSVHQPAVTLDEFDDTSLEGLRLGIDWAFFKDTDTAVSEQCERALRFLETKGAVVVDIQIPELEETRVAHVIAIGAEMAENLQEEFANNFVELNPESRAPLAVGGQYSAFDYYQAQKQRTRTMKFLQDIFEKECIDCIITPGLGLKVPPIPASAAAHGESNVAVLGGMMRFCQLGNLSGIPGITLPVGYDDKGLPISIQCLRCELMGYTSASKMTPDIGQTLIWRHKASAIPSPPPHKMKK